MLNPAQTEIPNPIVAYYYTVPSAKTITGNGYVELCGITDFDANLTVNGYDFLSINVRNNGAVVANAFIVSLPLPTGGTAKVYAYGKPNDVTPANLELVLIARKK